MAETELIVQTKHVTFDCDTRIRLDDAPGAWL